LRSSDPACWSSDFSTTINTVITSTVITSPASFRVLQNIVDKIKEFDL
jgi:hypothetical protein